MHIDNFFEKVPKTDVLAVACPEWLGIKSSSQEMFDCHLYVGEQLKNAEVQKIGSQIALNVSKSVVIQGFPLAYENLVKSIKRYAPDLPIFCIWHGSFLQSNEEINWTGFKKICELHKKGLIKRIAFVKEGMAEIMRHTGIDAFFLKNWVNRIPPGANRLSETDTMHCGVWSSTWCWRKPPFAMLAAAGTMPGVRAHMYGENKYVTEFIDELDLHVVQHKQPVDQYDMPSALLKMHLNLYVTLSECAPMLPLESLSYGVPCLFGPNSHYFLDNRFLHEMLVVSIPDSAHMIRRHIACALEARSEIIDEYIKYAHVYNAECRRLLNDFLNS